MAALHSGTGEEHGGSLSPMIASCVFINLGSATEFAHHHDERFLQRPALMQVVDQRTQAPVEIGQLLVEALKNLRMMVPASVVHGDKAHPAFHQTAGQQAALSKLGPTVGVAQCLGFLLEGEGVLGVGRQDHVGGLLSELIVGGHLVVAADVC